MTPFFLLFITSVAGQMLRFPLGNGVGFLVLDVMVFFLVTSWTIQKLLFHRTNPFPLFLSFPFFGFIFVSLFSLLLAIPNLPNLPTILISLFYWIRFITYGLLMFMAYDLIQKNNQHGPKLLRLFFGSALGLALLGFLQLIFFPSFSAINMYKFGWDPHIGRLLSTWFDPNFLGSFFAIVLSVGGGLLLIFWKQKKKYFLKHLPLIGILCLILIALLLTYSRSAYLGLLVAGGILGLMNSRTLLIIGMMFVVLSLSFSPRAQERVFDAVDSAKALFTETIVTLDPTARLRLESWKQGIDLLREHPFLGVGYNTLRYELTERGLVGEKSHAGSGIDASFLTVLATTGIIGFSFFLWWWGAILFRLFHTWKHSPFVWQQGTALGLFCGILGLFVNALFINSLFFPFLLVFLFPLIGATCALPTLEKTIKI